MGRILVREPELHFPQPALKASCLLIVSAAANTRDALLDLPQRQHRNVQPLGQVAAIQLVTPEAG